MESCVVLLSLLFLVSLASATKVLDFGDDDFDTKIKEHDVALVEFYAPWCGHCKRLAPEYDKASIALNENDPPVTLVKVDCINAGKDTCGKFGVGGFPTLKIFRDGEVSQDYNGPRDADGIVKYMKAQVGPSSKELLTPEDLEKFIAKEEVGIAGFFSGETSLKTTFLKVADKQRESARFGHSSADAVLNKAGKKDVIVLYQASHLRNKLEPSEVVYDGKESTSDIISWIEKNYHGLVGHRTYDNSKQFDEPLVVAYYKVDYKKNAKGTNYWRNRILKVASQNKGVRFAISNKDEFTHELNEFGVEYLAGDKPLVTARDAEKKKYVMKEEFSVEALEKFVQDFSGGVLEPYLKSEEIPEDNSDPVKVAVGKNFDDLVLKSDKDTLIEFYAPWCGHCKKLAPIFEELGLALEKESGVQIVKMDATANDVTGPFNVQGFPTLYWLPKNDKQNPERYEGGRELDDFIKFIASKATDELKTYDRSGKKKKTEL